MSQRMNREEMLKLFKGGLDCSQVVLMQFAEELGYDETEMAKIAASFGGGMFRGDTCGAVCGAHIALGMKYGHSEMDDQETKALLMSKISDFQKRFIEKHGTLICRELVGYDFSQPGDLEKASQSGKLMEICPNFVDSAIEILEEIL